MNPVSCKLKQKFIILQNHSFGRRRKEENITSAREGGGGAAARVFVKLSTEKVTLRCAQDK